jgi:hypothetical protein
MTILELETLFQIEVMIGLERVAGVLWVNISIEL